VGISTEGERLAKDETPEKRRYLQLRGELADNPTLEEVPDGSILYSRLKPQYGHLVARQIP
jgi:hypothetical protein